MGSASASEVRVRGRVREVTASFALVSCFTSTPHQLSGSPLTCVCDCLDLVCCLFIFLIKQHYTSPQQKSTKKNKTEQQNNTVMTLLRASISLHARVATARRGFPRAFTITPLAPHTSLSSSFSSFSSFSSSPCSHPSPSPYKVFLSEYSTKAIVNALPHDLASHNVDEKEKTKSIESTETTLPPNTITPTTATATGTTKTTTATTTTTTTTFVAGPAGDAGFCSTSNVPIADRTVGITNARELLDAYMSLSKVRLSSLVVVTTMAGYVLAPAPFHVDAFLLSSIGTALAICSANTFNQIYEVANDAQMARTRQRILPTGRISMRHAYLFGSATGIIGPTILLYTINPLAAALAFSNIALYAGIYTPLKRVHPINTWVGGIVGAIPPAIGWVAATNSLDMGAWVLGGLLFIWQIPHFLALSWSLKKDYGNAGYKMLSTVNPEILPKLCLRYCVSTPYYPVESRIS